MVDGLQQFFLNEKHVRCLKTLPTLTKESHIQAVLAVHLFRPLAARSSYIMNRNNFEQGLRNCPGCDEKVILGNTSFGHQDVWHGYTDIIVGKSAVEIIRSSLCQDYSPDKNLSDSGDECIDQVENNEHVKKKGELIV
ncbi:uncharacterized protein LOC132737288 [Ruditapes philippinarum]|uniref:uncharacterized protein LOC132737288 n=1 Tax=Ruditapes philippinarum TaxID=129788 RepID=UPI00295BBF0F|nr:uncharacterized protein LOC132737288 [Ruditapes philippinarum]